MQVWARFVWLLAQASLIKFYSPKCSKLYGFYGLDGDVGGLEASGQTSVGVGRSCDVWASYLERSSTAPFIDERPAMHRIPLSLVVRGGVGLGFRVKGWESPLAFSRQRQAFLRELDWGHKLNEIRWIPKVRQNPEYLIPWKFWSCSIRKACGIFIINSIITACSS